MPYNQLGKQTENIICDLDSPCEWPLSSVQFQHLRTLTDLSSLHIVSIFDILKTLTLLVDAGLFWRPNSDMDYRSLTCVCHLFACIYTKWTSHSKDYCRVCTEFDSGEISRRAQSLARNGHHPFSDHAWSCLTFWLSRASTSALRHGVVVSVGACFDGHKFYLVLTLVLPWPILKATKAAQFGYHKLLKLINSTDILKTWPLCYLDLEVGK